MKTKLTKTFEYNGMFFKTTPIPEAEQREVTILGVPLPVDPGFVLIDDGDKRRSVPTLVIEPSPYIDFEALLTKQQIKERKRCGFLFGYGASAKKPKRDFVPLKKCSLLPHLRILKEFNVWEKEIRALATKCGHWFCWRRNAKLKRLAKFFDLGSFHLAYGEQHIDKDRLRTALKDIEPVMLRFKCHIPLSYSKRINEKI